MCLVVVAKRQLLPRTVVVPESHVKDRLGAGGRIGMNRSLWLGLGAVHLEVQQGCCGALLHQHGMHEDVGACIEEDTSARVDAALIHLQRTTSGQLWSVVLVLWHELQAVLHGAYITQLCC